MPARTSPPATRANASAILDGQLSDRVLLARLILSSAARRTESRGVHERVDHPARDDAKWQKNTLRGVAADGATRLDYRPVHLNTLTSDVETVPLKARTY